MKMLIIIDNNECHEWGSSFLEMDQLRRPAQIFLFCNIILHEVKVNKDLFHKKRSPSFVHSGLYHIP